MPPGYRPRKPGLELRGKVSRINAYGASKQGDVVYSVIIRPERQDEQLRWNMTAALTIETR